MDINCCRICLAQCAQMYSIFQLINGKSLLEMISSITNVQIFIDNGCSDKICSTCCSKVIDTFEFKYLIIESNKRLQGNLLKNENMIVFNNLADVKNNIEILKLDNHNEVKYNINNIIKGLENLPAISVTKLKYEDSKQLYVDDLLHLIKDEPFEDHNDFGVENNWSDEDTTKHDYKTSRRNSDDDYIPPAKYKKRKKHETDEDYLPNVKYNKKNVNKLSKKEQKIAEGKMKMVCIKPILLKDIRTLPYKPEIQKNTKKVYKYKAKELICPYCGRFTRSLKVHILTHSEEKQFKCNLCHKGYHSKRGLEKHLFVHSNEKPFKCNKCVATFRYKESLDSHLRSHVETRQFVCDECSKAFKTKRTLKRHKVRHSSANKIIKCELCNMSFYEKWQLQHHMRVHTGERPFKCEICSQPYSYKHDFNRHCFKKHGVFLKRRAVYVMNEEVLIKERKLMKEIIVSAQSGQEGEALNPFEGPQGAMAYEMALKAISTGQLPLNDY